MMCVTFIKDNISPQGLAMLPQKIQELLRAHEGVRSTTRETNMTISPKIQLSVIEKVTRGGVLSRKVVVSGPQRTSPYDRTTQGDAAYEPPDTFYGLPDSTHVYFPLAMWWSGRGSPQWTVLETDECVVTTLGETKRKRNRNRCREASTGEGEKKHKPNN